MGLFETLRQRNGSDVDLREELRIEKTQNQHLEESMREMELALSDEGWRRLTSRLDADFTRDGLDQLIDISGAMYLSHPLIQRAVNVRSYYTWGQGVTIRSQDEKIQETIIDPFLQEKGNQASLFSHMARILTDVDQQCDGNTLFALFTDPKDGTVRVRDLPAKEIREIIVSPDDSTEIWFYRRSWNNKRYDIGTGRMNVEQREALYPDFRYNPPRKPKASGGIEIRWDTPVIHQKTGGRKNMLFGVPETYAALDWARAYRKFLEDWHTIVASLAKFAWKATVKGSKVKNAKTKFGSTITEESAYETNKPPPAGAVFIGSGADDFQPIPKTGATTSADDGRPSRLMIGAAMDLPDTILSGDADVGNHATAKTLDRPTELMITGRQAMWVDHHSSIMDHLIESKIRAGQMTDEDPQIDISFPPILEHDVESTVRSVISAATLDGKMEAGTLPRDRLVRLLMQAIGIEDVEAAMQDLDDSEGDALAQAADRLAKALAPKKPEEDDEEEE